MKKLIQKHGGYIMLSEFFMRQASDNFDQAVAKLKKAEETSDLHTDLEDNTFNRRKRVTAKPDRFIQSSSDSDDNRQLPAPPKIKRALFKGSHIFVFHEVFHVCETSKADQRRNMSYLNSPSSQPIEAVNKVNLLISPEANLGPSVLGLPITEQINKSDAVKSTCGCTSVQVEGAIIIWLKHAPQRLKNNEKK
ncbi:hypothetical protein NQ317_006776 [Molorchus minor]|uniref:Uncharacterized protein n=1 Tax=Molorchus minor TaxID=1323400 RepID=A0ABQ9IVH5_9CUCU|nr:hypothetical protein NQ317_006776 [Molorchus minor]